MKRIEIRASQLNELYTTVNHLHKNKQLTEHMDADIEHGGNVIHTIKQSSI